MGTNLPPLTLLWPVSDIYTNEGAFGSLLAWPQCPKTLDVGDLSLVGTGFCDHKSTAGRQRDK
jgi:hypothetical protein